MYLGSTYIPSTHAEVMDLLLNPLEPKPIQGAIDYGFYSKNFGYRFKYVKPHGAFWASFKGNVIQPGHPYQGLAPEKPTRFEKWQQSVWTILNGNRLDKIYHGQRLDPDLVNLMEAEEEMSPSSGGGSA